MSRIYEALERAENERQTDTGSGPAVRVETIPVPTAADSETRAESAFFDRIGRLPWTPSRLHLPTLADSGAAVEQFRGLRSSLYQIRDQVPLKTIVISSGMPSEGKTFVAANLAISLARNNERPILLVDADLRRPSVHSLLGACDSPGLSQYLSGSIPLPSILQRAGESAVASEPGTRALSNLALIPAGHGDDNQSPELAGNHRMEELIAALSPHFSWIIIDTPPALPVTDAVDLARTADGVLLVARGATTKFGVAQRALTSFGNARVLGFVLNAVKHVPRSEQYYYYRGYYTAKDSSSPHTAKRGQR
jgi:capsular exopolysaccharide synthesis family protein